MEASPQYFKGGRHTIAAIKETLSDPRIILMFRDPIDRIWSEYRFRKSRLSIPEALSFDDYVATCERVRRDGLSRTRETEAYFTLAGGFYADLVDDWLDAFGDDIRVLFFEDMAADAPSFVAGVCRWLEIDDEVVRSFNYSVENKSVAFRSKALQRLALAANSERFLRNRRRLKAPLRAAYRVVNRRGRDERMSPSTRQRLRDLFTPPNMALAAKLRHRGYDHLPPWLASIGT